jgi:hypothetical protein
MSSVSAVRTKYDDSFFDYISMGGCAQPPSSHALRPQPISASEDAL